METLIAVLTLIRDLARATHAGEQAAVAERADAMLEKVEGAAASALREMAYERVVQRAAAVPAYEPAEPVAADPEPGAEPVAADPEPGAEPAAADPAPAVDPVPAADPTPAEPVADPAPAADLATN